MSEKNRLVSGSDWIFAGVIAALAVVLAAVLWRGSAGNVVVVRHEGEIIGQYLLSEDQDISIHGAYDITLRIEDGGIYAASSTCPNGQCIAQGVIHREGNAIVCVPNRVSAYVEAEGSGQKVDAATG